MSIPHKGSVESTLLVARQAYVRIGRLIVASSTFSKHYPLVLLDMLNAPIMHLRIVYLSWLCYLSLETFMVIQKTSCCSFV